jgi:hypothetical protein
MASNPFITQAPATTMGVTPEALQLQRQQQFAAALLNQAGQSPQGQTVSGRFVAPSWTQQLSSAINPLVGAYMMNQADTKQAELTSRQQQLAQQNIADALRLSKGGEETVYGAGMEGPTKEVKQVLPDTTAAIAKLLRPNATALETSLGGKLLERQFKEPKWEKAEMPMPDGSVRQGWVDYNSPNPKNTFIEGGTKPALSAKDIYELQDKGINVGGNMPSSGMPMAGGQGGGTQTVNMGAQAMGYTPKLAPVDSRALALDKAKRQQDFAEKAPAALEMMNQTLTNIDDLIGDTKVVNGKIVYGTKKPHEGFESSVGFSGAPLAKYISGSPVSDFRSRFDQIKDKTFLQAFENLKGAGQITEVEGAKATSALNRMSLAQSEKEFITAAREFEQNIKSGMELARKRAGMANSNSGWRVKP